MSGLRARIFSQVMFGVALVVSLAALLIVGGLVWLRTPWGHDWVRGQILTRLGEAVVGTVRLGAVEGDVLRGVTLDGFALIGADGVTLVAADRIQVRYALRPFLDKRIVLDEVRLVRPEINLVRGPDGRWNFQTLFKPSPAPPAGARIPGWGSYIDVDAIEFVDGAVDIGFAEGGWSRIDWAANRFEDVNGVIGLGLTSRGRRERRFRADDFSFRSTAPALTVQRLDGTGIWTTDSLVLEAIEIETAGSRLRAGGHLALGLHDSFALAVEAPRLDLEEVKRFFPGVRVNGTARFDGRVTGPFGNPTVVIADGAVDTGRSQVTVQGSLIELANLRLDLRLATEPLAPEDIKLFVPGSPIAQPVTGVISLTGPPREVAVEAALRAPAGGFTLGGTLDFRRAPFGYDLDVTSDDLAVGPLFGRRWALQLSGAYQISGRGVGPNDLDARLVAELGRSRIYRWDVIALETAGRLRGRTYYADTLTVRMPQSVLQGRGAFALARQGAIAADFTLDSEDLGEVWPGLGESPARTHATARLDGVYTNFSLTGTIDTAALDLRGMQADSGAATVAVSGIGSGRTTMRATGTFTGVKLAAVAADTATVRLDYAAGRMALAATLAHRGEAQSELAGTVDFTGPQAAATLEQLVYASPDATWRLTEGSRLTLVGGELRADNVRIEQDGQTLSANGVFSFRGSSDLTVAVENIELREIARLLGHPPGDWQGQATVRGTLRGPRAAPLLSLTGLVSEGEIRGFQFFSIAGDVEYAGQLADVNLTVTTPTEGHALVLAGTVPVDLALVGGVDRRPNRPVDLRVTGTNTDLSLLGAFIPGLSDLAGPIDLAVTIAGTSEAPLFDGLATLRGGQMTITATEVTYEEITGRITFTNDRITFAELTGTDGSGGTFRLGGTIEMANLQLGALDLELTGTELLVLDADQREVQINGQITITGSTSAPVIAGRVEVDEAIYKMAARSKKQIINLDQAVLYVEIPGTGEETIERSPSLWERSRVQLAIAVTDDAILTSTNARIELSGALDLFKPEGTAIPTLSGTLDVRRGYYEELGLRFIIEGGEVFFFGTPDLNPGLHVVATRSVEGVPGVGDVNIRITVGGTIRNPTIDLTSTPAYDRSEIIAIALFGTPYTSAAQQGQFTQTVQGLITGTAGAQLQAALADELNIDLFEFSQRDDQGETANLFRIGKYLSPDIYVSVEQQIGGVDGEQTAIGLRYQVTDLFTLQATAGTREQGLDLFWEFTY
ncbi:MAG: translocation/assembly module TamB domain-containing protein [Gemmatimonadota bacterium]